MPSLLNQKKNSVLFPKGHESYIQDQEKTTAVKHKWVRQGNGFVCVGCPYRHTINVGADKYYVDNYKLKRIK